MYRITKTFRFSASHQLHGVPADHKCARLHGHNYEVTVCLEAEELTQREEWVVDYGDLDALKEWIDTVFDHRHLNELFSFNPTAEVLARYIHTWTHARSWPVRYVEVRETPNTSARYYPPRHQVEK